MIDTVYVLHVHVVLSKPNIQHDPIHTRMS